MSAFAGPLALLLVMAWVGVTLWTRAGKGGKFGEWMREQDRDAWQKAVKDKQRELDELLAAKPREESNG